MSLSGNKLAGGNPAAQRVENDFYATNPNAVNMILNKYNFYAQNILEPCVGQGHIAYAIDEFYNHSKNITAIDIVDRGYPNTIVTDFLNYQTEKRYDGIITNPPYSLAKEFVEHSMDLLDNDEFCIMLLKIQFLEGKARKELFKKYPPKFVWVFSERQKCLKNDKDTGGSSAVCYCWFIWQKGFNGKPLIDWL